MTPITKAEIDELDALEKKATPGPFKWDAGMRNPGYCPASAYSEKDGKEWPVEFHTADMEADAELYAALRNAWPRIKALAQSARVREGKL